MKSQLRTIVLLISFPFALAWVPNQKIVVSDARISKGQATRVFPILKASKEEDSAMSAYDRAMASMAKARESPSATKATLSQTTNPQATTSKEQDASADSTMGAYDRAMANMYSKQKAKPEPDFITSTFNDPNYISQEKETLEEATSWTQSTEESSPAGLRPTDSFKEAYPSSSWDQYYQRFQQQEPEAWEAPLQFVLRENVTSSNASPETTAAEIPTENRELPLEYSANIQQESLTTEEPESSQQQLPVQDASSEKQTLPLVPPQTQQQSTKTRPFQQSQQFPLTDSGDYEIEFSSTSWEDQKPVDPMKAVTDVTRKALGGKERKSSIQSTTRDDSVVTSGVTKRIFESLDKRNPGTRSAWESFQNAEKRWELLKNSKRFTYDFKWFETYQDGIGPPLLFITDDCARGNKRCCSKLREKCEGSHGSNEECTDLDFEAAPLDEHGQPVMDFDVIVLGGTLGIFYATALQLEGLDVCVVAPLDLKGQDQEWNVSLEDLLELKRLGIISGADIDASVTTQFGGTRVGFKNREVTPLKGGIYDNQGTGYECYIDGVLNVGVSPKILIERVTNRFKSLGGTVRERAPPQGVVVSELVGCAVDLGSYNPNEKYEPITSKMILDCMGYGSPIARQQRYGEKPDSMCMVFGSCASGYNPTRNRFGDAMYSFDEIRDFKKKGQHQYFWEAFPVGTNLTASPKFDKEFFDIYAAGNPKATDARRGPGKQSDVKTTYMFTYIDPDKERPSLEDMMEDYWKMLPRYQTSITDPERDLDIKRVLYDFFPAYRDAPMKPRWSRLLSVGEAAGFQSPISFGGFRSLGRHLGRISGAVAEAVQTGCLHKDDLEKINAYTPNLSAAWLFRDVMSVPLGKETKPTFTNRVLAVYCQAMYDMGPEVINPFLSDVIRLDNLIGTVFTTVFRDPFLMGEVVRHVGLQKFLNFLGHVNTMGMYGFLDKAIAPPLENWVEKISNPRQKFQWRRRMEAWKYGSGNDFDERKKKMSKIRPRY